MVICRGESLEGRQAAFETPANGPPPSSSYPPLKLLLGDKTKSFTDPALLSHQLQSSSRSAGPSPSGSP